MTPKACTIKSGQCDCSPGSQPAESTHIKSNSGLLPVFQSTPFPQTVGVSIATISVFAKPRNTQFLYKDILPRCPATSTLLPRPKWLPLLPRCPISAFHLVSLPFPPLPISHTPYYSCPSRLSCLPAWTTIRLGETLLPSSPSTDSLLLQASRLNTTTPETLAAHDHTPSGS